MWINWDIGSAFFGLLRHSWIVNAGVSLPRLRQVVLDIDYITDPVDLVQRIASPQIKVPRGDIASAFETEDAISRSSGNIASVNKRERYLSLFHTQLKMAIEKQNAKQLEKQARGRWYRIRAVARLDIGSNPTIRKMSAALRLSGPATSASALAS